MTLLDDLSIGLFVPNVGTVNQIRNPSGENGSIAGWQAFEVMELSASSTSGGPLDHGIAGPKLIGTTTAAGGPAGYAVTNAFPAVAGQYVAVKYEVPYVDGGHRVGFEFLSDGGAVEAVSAPSSFRAASGSQQSYGGILVTNGIQATAYVRLVFYHYANSSDDPAALNAELIFRNVKLGIGSSSAIALNIVDRGVWHDDLKGSHASLKITRAPMQPGLVSAALKSHQLPVGRDAQLTPGEGYRVLLGTDPILEVALTARGSEESTTKPRPLTTIEGADAARVLAMRTETRVTESTFDIPPLGPLWQVFSEADLPWLINGSAAQGAPMEIEGSGVNENMKAIDQIVLARDMNAPAYAWLDRTGRGNGADLAHLSSAPAAVLDEAVYSQLVTGFDMDSCFNIVTLKEIASGTEWGPYTDAVSVEAWGERRVTVGVTETFSDHDVFGAYFLTLNAEPVFQVLSVRIPLHKINNAAIALLDLYDLVTVQNTAEGIDQDLRVTSIEHEIKPLRSGSKWIMTLGFSVDGIAAIPQVLPDPPS